MPRLLLLLVRTSLAAATLFVAGGLVPIVGALAMVFAPVPVLIFAAAQPDWMRRSVAAVVIAAALCALAGGVPAGAGYLITFGVASVIICGMLSSQRPFELIVVVASAILVASGILAAWAVTGSVGALAANLHDSLAAGMARGSQLYKAAGLDLDIAPETQAAIIDTGIRLSPALAALSAASVVLMNLWVYWRWWGKSRLGYSLFADPARWAAPEWLIWVLLATGFAIFVPVAPIQTIALDGFICVAAAYFCQGLAIMAFYFKVLSMPRAARILIYAVAGIQPVLAALVCAAGIFDLWIDFRRLKPPSREAGNFNDFL